MYKCKYCGVEKIMKQYTAYSNNYRVCEICGYEKFDEKTIESINYYPDDEKPIVDNWILD